MKIDIASLPELETSVGIHGSAKQADVAGPVCLGVVVGIVIWTTGGE
jgi:hypothetical protein